MSFVFVFLTLMVFLTFFMSRIVQKIKPDLAIATNSNNISEIDKNTKLIIAKVIKSHIGD